MSRRRRLKNRPTMSEIPESNYDSIAAALLNATNISPTSGARLVSTAGT